MIEIVEPRGVCLMKVRSCRATWPRLRVGSFIVIARLTVNGGALRSSDSRDPGESLAAGGSVVLASRTSSAATVAATRITGGRLRRRTLERS